MHLSLEDERTFCLQRASTQKIIAALCVRSESTQEQTLWVKMENTIRLLSEQNLDAAIKLVFIEREVEKCYLCINLMHIIVSPAQN